MMQISIQNHEDLPAIDRLITAAFGAKRFERSVWMLRPGEPVPELCLMMKDRGEMVGSLRFWQVRLGDKPILLLGPLAVQPSSRGLGYGSSLVTEGLKRAREDGRWDLVLVSGEVEYYPKFGFVPAAPYNLQWPGFIEQERLQFYELTPGALGDLPSTALPVAPF